MKKGWKSNKRERRAEYEMRNNMRMRERERES
jgi:hypothetical protein